MSINSDEGNTDIFKNLIMTGFISWNCQNMKLQALISDHGPICFAFQETYLETNDTVIIRGYRFKKYFHNARRATGGIAILVSNNFSPPLTLLPH